MNKPTWCVRVAKWIFPKK